MAVEVASRKGPSLSPPPLVTAPLGRMLIEYTQQFFPALWAARRTGSIASTEVSCVLESEI